MPADALVPFMDRSWATLLSNIQDSHVFFFHKEGFQQLEPSKTWEIIEIAARQELMLPYLSRQFLKSPARRYNAQLVANTSDVYRKSQGDITVYVTQSV